jgi:ligand-binding sensor domain-containing protein
MHWRLAIYLLLLFLAGGHLQLSAQKYAYVRYHAGSDAPFNQVSTIVQDQEGFIWLGSKSGLFRFDGRKFEDFSIQTPSRHIYQLQGGEDQLIFVNDIGIYRIDQLASKPEVHALLQGSIKETRELPFFPNNCILGKKNEVWISQSNHSLGRFQEGNFETYPFTQSEKEQHIAIAKAPNGDIWALSPLDGLFYFDQANNRFEKKAELKKGNALMIHEDHLLVGGDVLYIFSLQSKDLQLTRTIPLEDDIITALHLDESKRFLIGTQKGKLLLLPHLKDTPQTVYGANETHRVRELDFGQINEIYVTPDPVSHSGILWICSETGLWLLQQRLFESVLDLPKNNPIGIAFGKDKKVWVPMSFLYEIRPDQNDFRARQVIEDMMVNAVACDQEGNNWVSISLPKVELLKMSNYTITHRYSFGDRGESIFYLYPDSKNNIWFCQAPLNKPIIGIGKIKASGEVELYDESHGFESRVLVIKESNRGEIYAGGIGTDSYLYKYQAEQNKFINLSPPLPFSSTQNFEVHDLTIDNQGIVWLASTDGLLRYDSEKITLIQNDVLDQEEVRGVTHLPNGNIWIATATKGLVFYQQNSATIIDEAAGMPSVINAYRCIDTDPQGRVWAGTPEGLVYARIAEPTLPFSNPPRIQKITVNRSEYTEAFDSTLQVRETDQLQLEYTNLSFPADRVQFQYRIYPKEEKELVMKEHLWLSNHGQHSLKLDKLAIGDYCLEIRARQSGGYLWSPPLEIQLEVFRPWYLKAWFLYPSGVALFLIAAYYLQFFVRRRIRRLNRIVQFARENLAEKQTELNQKMEELDMQQEELASAQSNIHMLELFIREIPQRASWNDIITAMGKAVDQSVGIDAFEICFLEKNEIVHRGYSNQGAWRLHL